MSVRIYVEGGGDQGSTKSDCRKAFRLFFEKIIPRGSFSIIASGGRRAAFDDFCAALTKHQGDYIVLLVDSEEAVTAGVWEHLRTRVGDGWHRPVGIDDGQANLMVQCMESWLLADRETVIAYYGSGFLAGSLPGQPNVELIAKPVALEGLRHCSKFTKKGEYHKTRHGFDLMERIDPAKVRVASAHARRLFDVLVTKTV